MVHVLRHVVVEVGLTSEVKKFPLHTGATDATDQVQLWKAATHNNAQVM